MKTKGNWDLELVICFIFLLIPTMSNWREFFNRLFG